MLSSDRTIGKLLDGAAKATSDKLTSDANLMQVLQDYLYNINFSTDNAMNKKFVTYLRDKKVVQRIDELKPNIDQITT